MIYILAFLQLSQIIILSIFVYQSIRQRRLCNKMQPASDINYDDFDVIIAAKEDYPIIYKCINNVFSAGFKYIFLCIDGGSDNLFNRVKTDFPYVTLLRNQISLGKIKSQIKCLNFSSKDNVLILDADIALIKEELNGFISYFLNSNVDFLCPYSLGLYTGDNTLLYSVAETDRHMRQRVVRAGRDAYGVSNLSGYCMLAKRLKYIDIIDADVIQDDVIATINLLEKKYTVKTYHRTVCSEIERSTFKSYLMQKTRWTAGNILLVRSYKKLFNSTSFVKACAFSSSFLLWYWSLWIDFITFIFGFMYPFLIIFLVIEGIIKFVGLYCACKPQKRIFDIFLYILVWPFFSTMCLLMTPYFFAGKNVEQKTRR